MGSSKAVRGIIFNSYKYLIGSRLAARALNRIADSNCQDIGQLVDLAFNFEFKGNFPKPYSIIIKPLQIKSEIEGMCRAVQELNPKIIAEIGTASGGTLFLFGHVVKPDTIISIDLPGGLFGGGYPSWKIPLFKSLGRRGVIDLIRADSHTEQTRQQMIKHLANRKIDFLFIDGDHTYEGVKQDFKMYAPLVRKGGMVAFHDIVIHDPSIGCHVDKFWKEIRQKYTYIEIIQDIDQKWAGIGLLYL